LLRALDERLARAGLDQGNGPVIVTHGKARAGRRISPIAWVVLALVGAGLVYLALDRWLDAAIARLAV
jgi:type VI secretion system protein ImpK